MRRGNSYVVRYRRDGQPVWRSFKSKEEAELELARAMVRKAQGQSEPSARRMTLAEHADWWLGKKKSRVGRQTFVNYESVLRVHVLPSLGHLELRRVGRETLDDFVTDWTDGGPMFRERVALAQERERARAQEANRPPRPIRLGRSPKTIANAVVVLSALFGDAVKTGRIAASPAVALERPKDDRPTDERMQPLDAAGLRLLIASAETPLARALLTTAGLTGCRRGELLGLRWGDIDYLNRRVWVRRAIGLEGVKTPKTRGSIRAITLSPMLAAELESWWKETRFRGETDYVFPSSTGTPLDGRNVDRKLFQPTRRRAGLSLRFHDLRHTFASILIAQGEHPKKISEQLGHASIAITIDRYGHLFDRSYSDVSDALERAWAAAETAHIPAHIEGANGAAAFHTDSDAETEIPANAAV
jgi:integrase